MKKKKKYKLVGDIINWDWLEEFTPNQIIIYSYIINWNLRPNYVFVKKPKEFNLNNEEICNKLKMSLSSVKRNLNFLEVNGFIIRVNRNDKRKITACDFKTKKPVL